MRPLEAKRRCSNCRYWDDWSGTGSGWCVDHDHTARWDHICADFRLVTPEEITRPASKR